MTNASFPNFTGTSTLNTNYLKVGVTTSAGNIFQPKTEVYCRYNTLFINTPFNGRLNVFDITGRLLLNQDIKQGLSSFDLPNAGIYLVKVFSEISVVSKKIRIE